MAFIGKEPQVGAYNMLDALTASATASYSLTLDSTAFVPESANHLLVSLNGVIQKAGSSYTVSGSTLTFSSSLASSDSIDFVLALGNVLDIGTPSDATVTNAKTNFVSTSSAAGLQIKGDGTTDGTLQLNCSQNSHGIKLKSPAHSTSSSYTLTFPGTDPAADKMLQTDGSGNLSFVDAPSGSLVKVADGNTTSGSVSYVDVAGCFTSTYKIYKIFLYDVNTSVDTAVYMRWLTGSSTEQAGSNAYSYGITGYNSDNQGSSNGGVATYMNLIGENMRHDSGEHFAMEGTLYNPAGTTQRKRFNYLSGGRRVGQFTCVGAGSAEWTDNTAVTGFRFLTNTGNIDSLYYVVYGLVI